MTEQYWKYTNAWGQLCVGVCHGTIEYQGTDVVYQFHRHDKDFLPMMFPNGKPVLDFVRGVNMKTAQNITAEVLKFRKLRE